MGLEEALGWAFLIFGVTFFGIMVIIGIRVLIELLK